MVHSASEPTFKAGWQDIDQQADPGAFVRYMDDARPLEQDTLASYQPLIDLLQVGAGDAVLDVGCGTGGAVRALAALVGADGRVAGIDLSETMIAEARRRTEGVNALIEFRVADAAALPFAAETFSRCLAYGVFEIVAQPDKVVAEMVRVLRPDGRLALRAPDTMLLDASNRALTRRIMDYIDDHECNGWAGRQVYRLFKEQGLVDITVLPKMHVLNDFLGFHETWLGPCLARAQAAGVVSKDEATRWLDELAQRGRQGRFFAASTMFWCGARKPA